MRMEFSKQSDAQSLADRLHDYMLANDTNYAASCAANQTRVWAVPYQMTDENGKVISAAWCVNVKERCLGALSDVEQKALQR